MNITERILSILKNAFQRLKDQQLKMKLLQALPFWTASLLTGVVAVLYTKLFRFAEEGTMYVVKNYFPLIFILVPVCFISSWWLVKYFSPEASGSGIPQVMAAVELSNPKNRSFVNKLLSLRMIVIKILSSLIMALGGGTIGREGPTIQIAASIFTMINNILPKWWPKVSGKNMILTGAAAGLAAAFNTPLGGIVFAVEELSKSHLSYFKSALFTAVIIAGLTAKSFLGPYLYLGFPKVTDTSNYIFLAVMLVSVIAGISGSLMSKIMILIFKWKSKFKFNYQHILYLLFCSFLIAFAAYYVNVKILGSGKDLITHSLFTSDKHVSVYLPFLRMGSNILSFTTGAAGGVFAPALSIGSNIGAVVSTLINLSPDNTNLIILCGMVGFLTGVTRSPFTSAILVLEMTDRHSIIFHLMLASMLANFVSILIDKVSLYDRLKKETIKSLFFNKESLINK
ncbi:MAG: hypothetical protein NVS3B19_20210 [Ginsengibacter sp.]